MDQKLKERLLGAVIILSVLIFFLPMLFKQNTDNVNLSELNSELDEQMADRVALEAQLKELELEKEYITQSTPVSVEKSKVVKAPAVISNVITKEAKEPGKTWVLRMGVFSNPNNAKLLEQNLSAKGYSSYSQVDMSKGAKITRVFVGPKKSESEIKKIQDQIKQDLKMQGIVMQYPERGATT